MRAFDFRLERVLRWRAAQLATEETKLQRLIEEQTRAQQQIHLLRAEKLKTEGSTAGLGSLHGADLASLHGYRFHADSEERRLMELLKRKDQEIAAQQQCYREAKRQCRLLEELRKRRFTAWRYAWDKELEEIAAESFTAARFRERSGDEH
jgi:flagellar export protein FliJ